MTTLTKQVQVTNMNIKSIVQKVTRWLPSLLLIIAAILIYRSMDRPYWNMHLDAVQYEYRGGLDILVYVDSMEGKDPVFDELRELNNLNHYIGMRPLNEAAEFERSIAEPSLYAFMGLLAFTAVVLAVKRNKWTRWSWLLAVPALLFPAIFLADLYYWLRDSGQNLDPNAPFSSSIHPFTPPVWGEGTVGQFHTVSNLDEGWYMAAAASGFILAAMLLSLVHFLLRRRKQEIGTEHEA
jgi:copper chaperone NosL